MSRREGKRLRRTVTDGQIFQSMIRNEGRISDMATALKISTSAIYTRLRENVQLLQRFEDYHEALLDEAVAQARELVKNGDRVMILHVLRTLGAKRGLSDTRNTEGELSATTLKVEANGKVEHNHTYNFSNLPVEARQILLQAMRQEAPAESAEQEAIETTEIDGITEEQILAAKHVTDAASHPRPPTPPAGMFEL